MYNNYCTDTSAAIAGGRLHAAWRKRLSSVSVFFFQNCVPFAVFLFYRRFLLFFICFLQTHTHKHSRSVEYCTHSHTGDRGPDEIRMYFNSHSINSTMYRKFKRILFTDIIIVVINIIFLFIVFRCCYCSKSHQNIRQVPISQREPQPLRRACLLSWKTILL